MTLHEHFTAASAEFLKRTTFKGASPCTLRNYDTVLNKFGDYLAAQPEDADLYEIVEAWRDAMLSGGRAPSTVKQNLITLGIFFGAASKRSFPAALRFSENPVDPDLYPIVKKKPYDNLLDDADIIKLWANVPPNAAAVHTWPRNYAVICMILGTGIRNDELRSLRLSDVSWPDATITIRAGKGDKFRIVDAPEIVLLSLEQYLNSGLRPAYLSDDDFLFGSTSAHEYGKIENSSGAERWHKMTGGALSQMIERHVCNVCGNPDLKIRSHDLRHLFARIHLNVNGNISELQSALGHSSPEISQIYAGRIAPRRARDSARAVLAARDAAAAALRQQNTPQQTVIAFPA